MLLATEKVFSPAAVAQAEAIITSAGHSFVKLKSYTDKAQFLTAAAECDAMIILSDKANAGMFDAAKNPQVGCPALGRQQGLR